MGHQHGCLYSILTAGIPRSPVQFGQLMMAINIMSRTPALPVKLKWGHRGRFLGSQPWLCPVTICGILMQLSIEYWCKFFLRLRGKDHLKSVQSHPGEQGGTDTLKQRSK